MRLVMVTALAPGLGPSNGFQGQQLAAVTRSATPRWCTTESTLAPSTSAAELKHGTAEYKAVGVQPGRTTPKGRSDAHRNEATVEDAGLSA
jgi:hypothetical protein